MAAATGVKSERSSQTVKPLPDRGKLKLSKPAAAASKHHIVDSSTRLQAYLIAAT